MKYKTQLMAAAAVVAVVLCAFGVGMMIFSDDSSSGNNNDTNVAEVTWEATGSKMFTELTDAIDFANKCHYMNVKVTLLTDTTLNESINVGESNAVSLVIPSGKKLTLSGTDKEETIIDVVCGKLELTGTIDGTAKDGLMGGKITVAEPQGRNVADAEFNYGCKYISSSGEFISSSSTGDANFKLQTGSKVVWNIMIPSSGNRDGMQCYSTYGNVSFATDKNKLPTGSILYATNNSTVSINAGTKADLSDCILLYVGSVVVKGTLKVGESFLTPTEIYRGNITFQGATATFVVGAQELIGPDAKFNLTVGNNGSIVFFAKAGDTPTLTMEFTGEVALNANSTDPFEQENCSYIVAEKAKLTLNREFTVSENCKMDIYGTVDATKAGSKLTMDKDAEITVFYGGLYSENANPEDPNYIFNVGTIPGTAKGAKIFDLKTEISFVNYKGIEGGSREIVLNGTIDADTSKVVPEFCFFKSGDTVKVNSTSTLNINADATLDLNYYDNGKRAPITLNMDGVINIKGALIGMPEVDEYATVNVFANVKWFVEIGGMSVYFIGDKDANMTFVSGSASWSESLGGLLINGEARINKATQWNMPVDEIILDENSKMTFEDGASLTNGERGSLNILNYGIIDASKGNVNIKSIENRGGYITADGRYGCDASGNPYSDGIISFKRGDGYFILAVPDPQNEASKVMNDFTLHGITALNIKEDTFAKIGIRLTMSSDAYTVVNNLFVSYGDDDKVTIIRIDSELIIKGELVSPNLNFGSNGSLSFEKGSKWTRITCTKDETGSLIVKATKVIGGKEACFTVKDGCIAFKNNMFWAKGSAEFNNNYDENDVIVDNDSYLWLNEAPNAITVIGNGTVDWDKKKNAVVESMLEYFDGELGFDVVRYSSLENNLQLSIPGSKLTVIGDVKKINGTFIIPENSKFIISENTELYSDNVSFTIENNVRISVMGTINGNVIINNSGAEVTSWMEVYGKVSIKAGTISNLMLYKNAEVSGFNCAVCYLQYGVSEDVIYNFNAQVYLCASEYIRVKPDDIAYGTVDVKDCVYDKIYPVSKILIMREGMDNSLNEAMKAVTSTVNPNNFEGKYWIFIRYYNTLAKEPEVLSGDNPDAGKVLEPNTFVEMRMDHTKFTFMPKTDSGKMTEFINMFRKENGLSDLPSVSQTITYFSFRVEPNLWKYDEGDNPQYNYDLSVDVNDGYAYIDFGDLIKGGTFPYDKKTAFVQMYYSCNGKDVVRNTFGNIQFQKDGLPMLNPIKVPSDVKWIVVTFYGISDVSPTEGTPIFLFHVLGEASWEADAVSEVSVSSALDTSSEDTSVDTLYTWNIYTATEKRAKA